MTHHEEPCLPLSRLFSEALPVVEFNYGAAGDRLWGNCVRALDTYQCVGFQPRLEFDSAAMNRVRGVGPS